MGRENRPANSFLACLEDIETDDPENLPLPDVRLLGMLNRVAALSGAAEPRDDSFHDDDT
jgi:hypothetical protein